MPLKKMLSLDEAKKNKNFVKSSLIMFDLIMNFNARDVDRHKLDMILEVAC